MKSVRIIGVPEHFNLPWHLAIEEGAFEDRGIELVWTDVPEGTGRMCELLTNNETDLAIILTEGIVKSISEGNPVKIVQEYISSPLLWGIHVAHQSSYQSISELETAPVAISRQGSGSHLMANVHAKHHGWDINGLKYETINNLDGAIHSFSEGSQAYFLWEHYTTKPWVEKRVFRRLGDFPTPWPCFVIAVTENFIGKNSNLLKHILEVINTYTIEFKKIPSIDRTLSNRYKQTLENIQSWLSKTEWGQEQIKKGTIDTVQSSLFDLKLIKEIRESEFFLYP
ncbi:substrate-binding domain-containing protein [Flagellimonas allohymeniacidonis]|uniref:ABC transporter substrate-binding protein n=1 Tax=Flagellimonas allohymeniacidonis TaxID=2517819 RepID=A0A4V2HSS9_9FLAO|nr:substrate-binding domain-containing protein [Allomuricauda hymeniacidonis]TAI48870.1 ABC transporter substrate-binding protein [Allomuricauda hymeniacidonis]